VQFEAGAAGGSDRSPEVGVEAPAVDGVGLARGDAEERRHHLVGLDEVRGAPSRLIARISSAMPGVFAPAPGLTMLTVSPVPSTLAHTSSAAFEAPQGEVCGRFIVSSLVVTLTMRPQFCSTIGGATRRAIRSAAM
jgi:hypothetical protein